MRIHVAAAISIAAALSSGCASRWQPRSATQATIYADTTELPVLWADSTFIGAIDGVNTDRGRGYVLADPGKRRFTVFHVGCPLPIIAIFCLRSASRRDIQDVVVPGAVYRIGPDALFLVGKDGKPLE